VDDHKRTVADLFGRAAASYDQMGFFHQVAQRLLAWLASTRACACSMWPAAPALSWSRRPAWLAPTGLVVGVDLAEPMAAVAARRLQQMDPA
jgi:hypothetical protein